MEFQLINYRECRQNKFLSKKFCKKFYVINFVLSFLML
jgi:hypothetical protein